MRGIIVDAFGSGYLLAKELVVQGAQLIHVVSSDSLPEYLLTKTNDELFIKKLTFEGDIASLVEEIKRVGSIQFCTSGAESGVLLAAMIADYLKLDNANNLTTAIRCRDKYAMQQCIKQAGLCSIPTIKSHDIEQVLEWKKQSGSECLVLKPLDGGGSVDVYFCYSEEDVKYFFNYMLEGTNVFNNSIADILVQKKIDGLQYIVNSVSFAGRHCVIDVWEDHRTEIKHANYIPDYEKLINSSHTLFSELVDYAIKVLDAMNFQFGAAHIELIVEKATGDIYLIEIGGRVQGGIDDTPIRQCYGISQTQLLALLLVNDARGRIYFSEPRYFFTPQTLYSIFFISHCSKILENDKFYNAISELKTLHTSYFIPRRSDKITKTIDLLTINGMVYLLSDHEDLILEELARIRYLENLYLN